MGLKVTAYKSLIRLFLLKKAYAVGNPDLLLLYKVGASFKTLMFGAYDFSLAPTFQITLIGNSLTQSFRILIGYSTIR